MLTPIKSPFNMVGSYRPPLCSARWLCGLGICIGVVRVTSCVVRVCELGVRPRDFIAGAGGRCCVLAGEPIKILVWSREKERKQQRPAKRGFACVAQLPVHVVCIS
jgi:hypothetical protein